MEEGQLGVEIENYESYLNPCTHRGIPMYTVSLQDFCSFSICCVPKVSLISTRLGNLKNHRQRTEAIYWKMPSAKA